MTTRKSKHEPDEGDAAELPAENPPAQTAEASPPQAGIEGSVLTAREEQLARSAEIERKGVEAYKDSIDERPADQRGNRPGTGLAPTIVEERERDRP
jgi:hypothetical protein